MESEIVACSTSKLSDAEYRKCKSREIGEVLGRLIGETVLTKLESALPDDGYIEVKRMEVASIRITYAVIQDDSNDTLLFDIYKAEL